LQAIHMKKIVYILTLLTLVSCDNLREIRKEGITFYFTDIIETQRQETISNEIIKEISELNYEELKNIKKIKIDSVPFSIVLHIPYSDSLTTDKTVHFKVFAKLLSDYSLDETPVNIILTDNEFKPIKSLTFDNSVVTYAGQTMISGLTIIELSENAPSFPPEALKEILTRRLPELYKSKDTVKVFVDMIDNEIKLDFNIRTEKINIDSLKGQFTKTDRLLFDILFANRTTYFQIKNSDSGELTSVFGLKGE
jgi:hypothetical protein